MELGSHSLKQKSNDPHLTHCGPVMQICVFALQLWKTDDAKLPFNTRLDFYALNYTIRGAKKKGLPGRIFKTTRLYFELMIYDKYRGKWTNATTNNFYQENQDATTNGATINQCYNEQFLSIKSGCYNKWRYNKPMLQWTIFIKKIRMLQQTQCNTIGWCSMHVRMMGLPALIRASVIIFVTVCKVQLPVQLSAYLYSV
jgi:hypothetical protein